MLLWGTMLIVLVAAAPSLALLIYFYLRDRYDREPVGCLLVAYLLGMYSMLAAQSMGAALADAVSEEWLHLGGEPARFFEAFVLSGLVEEVAKWTMLMAAVYYWRAFDEPLDGLIYGVTIALGFATLENFFYLSSHGVGIAWQRAIFAVPAHALFGGTMGYYAGRGKFCCQGRPARPRCLARPNLVSDVARAFSWRLQLRAPARPQLVHMGCHHCAFPRLLGFRPAASSARPEGIALSAQDHVAIRLPRATSGPKGVK